MVKKIIRFTADWCAPCKMFAPIYDKVAKDEKFSSIDFSVINVDNDDENMCQKYGIRNIPSVVLLDEQEGLLKKITGVVSLSELTSYIENDMS